MGQQHNSLVASVCTMYSYTYLRAKQNCPPHHPPQPCNDVTEGNFSFPLTTTMINRSSEEQIGCPRRLMHGHCCAHPTKFYLSMVHFDREMPLSTRFLPLSLNNHTLESAHAVVHDKPDNARRFRTYSEAH